MEKDLTKYKNIIKKKMSDNCRSRQVKAVKINGEVIILKVANKNFKRRYFNEKDIYLRLKDEDILPKLRYFDDKHLILGLTDVGTSFQIYKNINPEIYNNSLEVYNKEIKNIIDILYNKYGLYHNDLHSKNICIDNNNKIRLIDFDACSNKLKKRKYLKLKPKN